MQPQTILFSSSGSYAVAEGLYENLKERHNVTLWKQFFGENRTTPLWTFLKKLFHYDYAILVLANDSLVYDTVTQGQQAWIPKDNVIFELGATMARLGPQKTILLVPHEPEVHLPGYFDDVRPLLFTYTNQEQFSEEEKIQATAAAADGISALLDTVTYETFHSELPAQGLAHAYLNNFFLPVRNSGIAQELVINGIPLSWTPAAGIIFTIIVPGEIMGRQRANDYFEQLAGCYKISFKTNDGRDIGVYALPRKKESDPHGYANRASSQKAPALDKWAAPAYSLRPALTPQGNLPCRNRPPPLAAPTRSRLTLIPTTSAPGAFTCSRSIASPLTWAAWPAGSRP